MEDYTLSLALFDYLPVIVAGIGLYMICRYCAILGHSTGAWVAAIPLIAFAGGFLKATWTVIVVLSGVNIVWMSDQLFFLIASSYVLLASLVVLSLRAESIGRPLKDSWWQLPALVVIAVVAVAFLLRQEYTERYWAMLLLGVMSVSNLVFALRLVFHSVARRYWWAASAIVLNLVLAYTLVFLARIPEQTAQLQWIEEILTLLANSALAFAAWRLLRRTNAY